MVKIKQMGCRCLKTKRSCAWFWNFPSSLEGKVVQLQIFTWIWRKIAKSDKKCVSNVTKPRSNNAHSNRSQSDYSYHAKRYVLGKKIISDLSRIHLKDYFRFYDLHFSNQQFVNPIIGYCKIMQRVASLNRVYSYRYEYLILL